MSDSRDCSICRHDSPDMSFHVLPCQHEFHTNCIIQWFRSGVDSCPLCRNVGETNMSCWDIWERATYLRRMARRKDAPPELVNLVNALRRTEERLTKAKKEACQYKRRHKRVHKRQRELDCKRWRAHRSKRTLRRRLGTYSDERFPIPMLRRYSINLRRVSRERRI